jgi:integrase
MNTDYYYVVVCPPGARRWPRRFPAGTVASAGIGTATVAVAVAGVGVGVGIVAVTATVAVAVIGTGPGSESPFLCALDPTADRNRRPGGRGGRGEGETPARPVLVDTDRDSTTRPPTSTAPPWPNPWPTTADSTCWPTSTADRDLDLDPARSGRIATLDLDPARCRAGQRNYHDLRRGAGRVENLTGGTNQCRMCSRLWEPPLPADAEIVQHRGKPHVRIRERGGTKLYPLTADGTKYLKPSKCWYFNITDADGQRRRVKGYADKAATEALAVETQRRADRRRAGLIDPCEEHLNRPWREHLADYETYLVSKGTTARHRAETMTRIRTALTACEFTTLGHIEAGKVGAWLTAQRCDRPAVELPPGDAFQPCVVAALLGVTVDTVARQARSLGLSATGGGKARRYSRPTVEALLATRGKGMAPATTNHYVTALRSFGRWLVRSRRVTVNPFETLTAVSTATDVRRRRRALSDDELHRLLDATRTSTRTIDGLTGPDRFALYLVAASTGIRAGALAGLTPRAFDLDSPSPCVTVPARLSKNRKTHTVPLRPDVAAMLREYLASKSSDSPVWPGSWASARRGAAMLRADLRDAGVPYIVDGPDGPAYADFHSLRHTFLTSLGKAGVELRVAQLIAGHSSPTITARYSHRSLADLADAVKKLPSLTGDTASVIRTNSVPEPFVGGHSEASSDNIQTINPPSGVLSEPVAATGFDATGHRESGTVGSEAGGGRTHERLTAQPARRGLVSPLLTTNHQSASRFCIRSHAPDGGAVG